MVGAGPISMGRMAVIVGKVFNGRVSADDVLSFLFIVSVALLVLVEFRIATRLIGVTVGEVAGEPVAKAEAADEAADGAVGEVYRLEVYDGRESKVVYVSRDVWERAGLDDIASSAAPTRKGASDAAAPAEQQAAG